MRSVRTLLLLAIVGTRPASAWVENLDRLGSGRFALFGTERRRSTRKTWDDAFDYCVDKGMRLAHVLSEDDKDDIWNLLDEHGVAGDDIWIGAKCLDEQAHCKDDDGKYYHWIDADGGASDDANGNEMNLRDNDYTNWGSGQPNSETRFCVEGDGDETGLQWNDERCTYENHFVCESTQYTVTPGGRTDGNKRSWSNAKTKCEDEGLRLAVINSADDQETVGKLLEKGDLDGCCSAWIGACAALPRLLCTRSILSACPHRRRELRRRRQRRRMQQPQRLSLARLQ